MSTIKPVLDSRPGAGSLELAQVGALAGRWLDRALVAMIAVNGLLLAFFICRGYLPDFHTDSAMKNLIAQEMVDTGRYFPADWNYVNGDLWVVFGQAFIAPLLPFARNGFALHAISGLVSAALILWGIWLVTKVLHSTYRARLLVLAVFAGSISMQVAENLYGQVSYGSVLYMACFQLYVTWRFLQAQSRRSMLGWGGLLAVLSALAFWSNPQRAAAYFLLPLAGAIGIHGLRRAVEQPSLWRASFTRAVSTGGLLVLGGAVGVLLHAWALAGANNIEGVSSSKWLAFPEIVRNVGLTVQGLFAIMGGTLTPGASVMSAGGAVEGGRLALAVLNLTLIPFAVIAAFRSRHEGRRFVATFAAVLLVVFLFLQVFTSTAEMSDPVNSSRYMLPAVMFGLIVLFGSIGDEEVGLRLSWLAGLAALGLAFATYLPGNPLSRGLFGVPHDARRDLVHFLEAEGLKYGYATYWNSGALTVISDFDVRVRQVWIENGNVLPFRHLNSNRWYAPDFWRGDSFLMLTDQESATIDWARFEKYAGTPVRRLRFNDMNILVFKDNLASRLPFWSNDVEASFPIGVSTLHLVGKPETVSGQEALVVRAGEAGFVHYGPYMTLGPGRYRADLVLMADAPSAGSVLGKFDATAQRGQRMLGEIGIRADRTETSLDFTVPKTAQGFELRVWVNGSSGGVLKSLTLKRIGSASPDVDHARTPATTEQG